MAGGDEPFAEAALAGWLNSCSMAVFAPSPALTVTIEHESADPEIHLHGGGQGYWVARMAARLGADVTLCVPLGGETGQVLQNLLAVDGITLVPVPVHRGNGAYVHDRRDGRRVEIAQTPSPELRRHELDDLYDATLTSGLEADVTLLTGPRNEGVLPTATYERLASDLRANGRLVLADLSGDCLSAALRGGLDLLKVSDEELVRDGWATDRDLDRALAVAPRLRAEGAENVLISRGEQPALALLDGSLFEVEGPRFTPLDERGARDSMFAAVGVALGAGMDVADALKIGAAAGAQNVTRHGLGTGHPREIGILAAQVTVRPLGADRLRMPSEAQRC